MKGVIAKKNLNQLYNNKEHFFLCRSQMREFISYIFDFFIRKGNNFFDITGPTRELSIIMKKKESLSEML